MTEIAFHFNADNRLIYVCRLLRKAVSGDAKLVVTGSDFDLEQLDAALWTFSAPDFVPHCRFGAENSVRTKSPVVLASSLRFATSNDILINLGESVPDGFEQFKRLIEVVTLDELDRKMARTRWKFYAEAGFNLTRHDLQRVSA